MISNCPFCSYENFADRIIQEFEHGYWVSGASQFYKGHGILISKTHYREWHEVPEAIAIRLNQNLREIAKEIQNKFTPHKINLASLGNITEHLHWHIIPRYLDDPHLLQAPDFTLL